ncbi:nuclear factor of activated T-cells 5 isoform X3 [Pygocentrus nattereri]|uniref:nuclear factor of activated T-cells 5 isoform X3 n=1 Tax=Pygocentrus nattereri TaxID=42514 RepID=UPI0008145A2D|nr:nuclear factor of activated T-cells 5 isoform X3 [Pygocentrus nattereri]XP_017562783.1 nuclear factor of activated T-cells 5 isoform X3 [Pygocentrus nattereri]XP_017562784.1 nuclear factor of activated T-cells 5 isoform X3 [Pygocentrus nattereri]XP_037400981.1 nuclear factor of activated T-cells 5 isoform X3 [Pygocentrus nattereri]
MYMTRIQDESCFLARDASSISSGMTMGSPSSAFPTSSSFGMHSSTSATDRGPVHENSTPGEVGSRRKAEMLAAEGKLPSGSGGSGRGCGEKGGGASQQQHHHQMMPSKRPVLNISPPPEDLFDDSHMSGCQDDLLQDSEQSNSIWTENSVSNFSLMSSSSYNDNTEVPRKARKRTPRQRPGSKPASAEETNMDVFDADSAKGPHFVLSQLGPDSKACVKTSSNGNQASGQKGGILSGQYPQKSEGKELKILVQPETQHRARYLTEGSRGSVKDRTQQGFPTIKLEGMKEPVVLQVFVGNDAGRVKPHGFYQACRVTGRNTTACREVDIEGTTVIEVSLDPSNNMTLAVDCVGILKLRNADVEARIGVAGSKKKSTRARLVFRVNIARADGSVLTLQTPSSPILCTQPAGVPEILKKSLHSCSVQGGEEVFIIGKNFLKGTKVIFQENVSDEKSWRAEAEIDMELFHQNHLIVKVPPYQNQAITCPVSVGIYVLTNAGRSHDVQPFTYTPDPATDVSVKKETLPPVKPCSFEQIKVMDGGLMVPILPLVKSEEVTPMEVSSNTGNFKQTSDLMNSAQQTLEINNNISTNSQSFSSSLACQPAEQEQPQSSVFSSKEPLSTIQKQDIAPNSSFHVPGKPLLQQGTQQFLLDTESLTQERSGSSTGTMVGLSQMDDSPQHQLSLLPPDEVAQLEQAVRQLQAKGFCNIHLQSEDSLAKKQQHRLQQHQQMQQQIQQQQQQQQQQMQQQQVLENLQHQLFHPQVQMQCSPEQQGSSQSIVENNNALFQQPSAQQQQAALFQQAKDLISIQTSYLQQTPSHSSPPLFHTSTSLAEAQAPQEAMFHTQKTSPTQEQVQASLFQNTMNVLDGSSLSAEPQPSATSMFLSQSALPGQLAVNNNQSQQLAFLSSMQTSALEAQSVFQASAQLAPIQQSTPMDQQSPQQTSQTQPGSLFQGISQSSNAKLSPNQQQAGLLFNSLSSAVAPEQNSGLLFSGQPQMTSMNSSSLISSEQQNASRPFAQTSLVTVRQEEASEPMSFQDQSTDVANQSASKQTMFQEQQPMQLAPSSGTSSGNLFVAQPNMPRSIASQEALFAPQNGVAGLQTTTSSPVQQPGSLFQTTVSGSLNQPSQNQQPSIFLFEIHNDCTQLMNSQGTTLSDQIIAISQSGQNQRESDGHIHSLLNQSMSESGNIQNVLTTSQNMEKIDDLLVSLQEQGKNHPHSY